MTRIGIRASSPKCCFSTMGCRTMTGYDVNWKDSWKAALMDVINNGHLRDGVIESPHQRDGRGNISPVTLILPTLAMKAKMKVYPDCVDEKNYNATAVVEAFMKILDKKINEAMDMLLERFDWQSSQTAKSAKFMYENNTMCGYVPEEGIKSALLHGTLAIGQLGLAEALQVLIGCDHTEPRGMELAKRIEQMFKDKCDKFKTEHHKNVSVYMTPSENLCFTALKSFVNTYGVIKNVSDKDYFTNSMHVPVWHKMTPFEKIDIESQLTGYSSGGCITYVELDASVSHNIDALEELVNYAMEKDIPYFAINVPNDSCNDCHYDGLMTDHCPVCGSYNIRQLRRVTGYLSTTYKHFNPGKQSEVEERVKHSGVEA